MSAAKPDEEPRHSPDEVARAPHVADRPPGTEEDAETGRAHVDEEGPVHYREMPIAVPGREKADSPDH